MSRALATLLRRPLLRLALPCALVAAFVALPARSASADTILRFASLAPDGSSWMNLFHRFQKAVETRTEGRVRFKFYAGGSQGDEKDMLRKIKLGQLSGAAVTAIGLSQIDPEARAPEVARNYRELDALRDALSPLLRKRFEERGYILLGWGDVGPVHLFSNKPVRTMADLASLKPWLWSDDPISRKLFEAVGLHGVPMGVPDVLPNLSTGQIDSFFGSPLSTLALQWSSKVKYMSSMVMSQATGATVLSKAAFEQLSPGDQQILLDEAHKLEKEVLVQVRKDNARAMEAMKRRGLEVVPTPPELQKELRRRGEAVAMETGKTFSKEMQDKLKSLIDEYQARQKQGAAQGQAAQ